MGEKERDILLKPRADFPVSMPEGGEILDPSALRITSGFYTLKLFAGEIFILEISSTSVF